MIFYCMHILFYLSLILVINDSFTSLSKYFSLKAFELKTIRQHFIGNSKSFLFTFERPKNYHQKNTLAECQIFNINYNSRILTSKISSFFLSSNVDLYGSFNSFFCTENSYCGSSFNSALVPKWYILNWFWTYPFIVSVAEFDNFILIAMNKSWEISEKLFKLKIENFNWLFFIFVFSFIIFFIFFFKFKILKIYHEELEQKLSQLMELPYFPVIDDWSCYRWRWHLLLKSIDRKIVQYFQNVPHYRS